MTKKEILSKFHKMSMINLTQAEFVYERLIKLPEKGRLVDVGTGQGHAAMLFALTKPKWTIYTIDGFGMYGTIHNVWNTKDENEFKKRGIPFVRDLWERNDVKNIIQIVGNTWDIPWELKADVIFIDADHSYQGVEKDVKKFEPFLKKGGLLMFHDYNNTFEIKDYIDKNMLNDWNIEDKDGLAILKRK